MKWRNYEGCYKDEQSRQENLLNFPRKSFALFTVDVQGGDTVWLQYYWKVYVKVVSKYGDYIREIYFKSLEDVDEYLQETK